MMIFPCLVVQCPLGLIMFGGELNLTSFFPEAGVQERMKEHGKDPLWKIKYAEHFMNLRISFIKSQSDVIFITSLITNLFITFIYNI